MTTVDVVFMGSEDFSLPILHSLATDGPDCRSTVVGVVTQPDRPAGRGRKLASNPVKAFACTHGIPVLQPERLRDTASVAAVLELKPELIVVASYGQIIPRIVLDAPRHGSLNLHPSLLPRYRGASPITGPILAGDRETGTTLMLMRPKMDAGPIIAQEITAIGPDETAGELEARLAQFSAALLTSHLQPWLRGEIQPEEQDEEAATYTTRLEKADGVIDWEQSAEIIARRVRALNPWPIAHTFWDGRMIRILRAHVTAGEAPPGRVNGGGGEPMTVGTGNRLLAVDQLQIAGGKPAAPDEFLRGHRSFATATLGQTT
jgi:methionyl-tRNA formyltransferase